MTVISEDGENSRPLIGREVEIGAVRLRLYEQKNRLLPLPGAGYFHGRLIHPCVVSSDMIIPECRVWEGYVAKTHKSLTAHTQLYVLRVMIKSEQNEASQKNSKSESSLKLVDPNLLTHVM